MKRRSFIIGTVFSPIAAFLGIKIARAKPVKPIGILESTAHGRNLHETIEMLSSWARSFFHQNDIHFSGFRKPVGHDCFIGHALWRAKVTFPSGRIEMVYYFVTVLLPATDIYISSQMYPNQKDGLIRMVEARCINSLIKIKKMVNMPFRYQGYLECLPNRGRRRIKKAAKIEYLHYQNDRPFCVWEPKSCA